MPGLQGIYPVVGQELLADDIHELWLAAPALARAKPGQFVHLRCDGVLLRRPFSLYRTRGDQVSILYRLKGQGTRWMAKLAPGDSVDVLGPLGNSFAPPSSVDRLLLIGGGVGVAPMALYAQRFGQQADLRAIVGFRSHGQVAGLTPFKDKDVPLAVWTEDGSAGRKGRVTDQLAETIRELAINRILVCGPDPMMQAVAAIALAHGVRCEISVERPMGCGVGVCLACVVPLLDEQGAVSYQRACSEGPVFNAAEVVW